MFSELADLGVCASGRRFWRRSERDVSTIVKVWKKWPEYWIEHPDGALDIVRRYFNSGEDLAFLFANNIFLDRKDRVELDSDSAVFIVGDSDCDVLVKDWATVKIYCFNRSNVRILPGFHSYVNIESYDETSVSINSDKGKCLVYAYDRSEVTGSGASLTVDRKRINRGDVFNGKEIG